MTNSKFQEILGIILEIEENTASAKQRYSNLKKSFSNLKIESDKATDYDSLKGFLIEKYSGENRKFVIYLAPPRFSESFASLKK